MPENFPVFSLLNCTCVDLVVQFLSWKIIIEGKQKVSRNVD